MLHISTGGFRCEARAMKRTIICCVPLELVLRHGHLNVFYIRSTLDVATWRNCSAFYALGATSISTTLYTSTSVGPNTFSCRLLFIMRTYYVHAAWFRHTTRYRRCPPLIMYTVVYDGWLSPVAMSPCTVTMEYMFHFHQWCMVVVIGCQVA